MNDSAAGAQNPNGRIRVRVAGLCVENNHALFVKHKRFIGNDYFPEEAWILPGGAVEVGESAQMAVQREVREETGLECEAGKLLFVKELIFPFPLLEKVIAPIAHVISLCFQCRVTGGTVMTGRDPEISDAEQLILETRWLPIQTLHQQPIYPPFLAAFIQDHSASEFMHVVPHYYDSRA